MKNSGLSRRVIIVSVLFTAILVSIFVAEPFFSSESFKNKYIETINKKQQAATGLTVAAAGMATLLAAVPDDSTTPVADQIANTASYLVIVSVVLLFEKYLMGLSGYLVFRWLVPIACTLIILYELFRKRSFKAIACRVIVFAACIWLLVPVSVEIDKRLDETYHTSTTIEEAVNSNETLETTADNEQKGLIENATGFISGVTDSIKSLPEQGKRMLVKFMDGVALLILTTCVIPIIVLLIIVLVGKSLIRGIGSEIGINEQDIKRIVNSLRSESTMIRQNMHK
ncbi:MAG: hypothetical protein IJ573_10070 [Clostridia bacterium]|nr:hypothetical protein [Clostridia bacterium]